MHLSVACLLLFTQTIYIPGITKAFSECEDVASDALYIVLYDRWQRRLDAKLLVLHSFLGIPIQPK
jgi:hypothetical protein